MIKHEKWIDSFIERYLKERFNAKDYRLMNWICKTKELSNQQLKELNLSKHDSHEDMIEENKVLKFNNFNILEESKHQDFPISPTDLKTNPEFIPLSKFLFFFIN